MCVNGIVWLGSVGGAGAQEAGCRAGVRPLSAAACAASEERRVLRRCGESEEEEEGGGRGGGAEREACLGSRARRTATTRGLVSLYIAEVGARRAYARMVEVKQPRGRDKQGSKNGSKPSLTLKVLLLNYEQGKKPALSLKRHPSGF